MISESSSATITPVSLSDLLNEQSLVASSQRMHRYIRFCKGVAAIPLIYLALISYVALKALAWLYRKMGRINISLTLRYQAKKIYVLHALHHIDNLGACGTPLPVYSYAKNLTRSEVVSKGEDSKAMRNMRDLFLAKNGKKDNFEKLQKMSCLGAQAKGICFGATMSVIKTYLEANVHSEEELKNIGRRFEEGFDADAAGLQKIYDKVWNEKVKKYIQVQAKELQAVKETFRPKIEEAEFSAQKEAIHAKILLEIESLVGQYRQKTEKWSRPYINDILKLLGLEIETAPDKIDQIFFDHLDYDEDANKRFNALVEGAYFLDFSEHAVPYLKYSFGSYVLDPNNGLMPLDPLCPSKSLLTLVKSYGSSKNYIVRAYRMKTVPF